MARQHEVAELVEEERVALLLLQAALARVRRAVDRHAQTLQDAHAALCRRENEERASEKAGRWERREKGAQQVHTERTMTTHLESAESFAITSPLLRACVVH